MNMEQLNNETNGMLTWQKVFNVISGINFVISFFALMMSFAEMNDVYGTPNFFILITICTFTGGLSSLFISSVIGFFVNFYVKVSDINKQLKVNGGQVTSNTTEVASIELDELPEL